MADKIIRQGRLIYVRTDYLSERNLQYLKSFLSENIRGSDKRFRLVKFGKFNYGLERKVIKFLLRIFMGSYINDSTKAILPVGLVYMRGYFQSGQSSPFWTRLINVDFSNKSVAHVRLGDYVSLNRYIKLPKEYYACKVDFALTDDHELLEELGWFDKILSRSLLEDYVCLCGAKFVQTANSTFSISARLFFHHSSINLEKNRIHTIVPDKYCIDYNLEDRFILPLEGWQIRRI